MRTATAFFLALGILLSSASMAQDRSMDENVVRGLDNEERLAALQRDLPALDRLWSDQFTVNAPNNQVVVGKRAVLDTFVRAGVINFSVFERQIEYVRVDGAFVTIMGLETVQPVADAPTAGLVAGQSIKRRFTNIWKNETGTWRLSLRHANVIPTGRRSPTYLRAATREQRQLAGSGYRQTAKLMLRVPHPRSGNTGVYGYRAIVAPAFVGLAR